MKIDRKLRRRFYGLFLARGYDVNAVSDDDLAQLKMTRDEARALLSDPDFPWGELGEELDRREHFAEIASELGVSEEYLLDLRKRLHDPHGKPYS